MKSTNYSIGLIILLVALSVLISFITIAGGIWVGLYILHAFGLFTATVFTWKLALAAYLLFVLIGMIFGR